MSPAAIAETDLLDATLQTLTDHGYHGATIQRIADQAGVSRVTLHRRGLTRDMLIAGLVNAAVEDYERRMRPVMESRGDAEARLRDVLQTLCEAAEAHAPLLLALRSQSDEVFHEDSDEALTRSPFTRPIVVVLRDADAEGRLRELEGGAEQIATVLFNQVGWTYLHLRSGHGWPPQRAMRTVVEPALHGVLND